MNHPADNLLHKGTTAFLDGKTELAESLFRQALVIAPDNPQLLNSLGAVRDQAGDITEAIDLFRKATMVAPSFTEALCNLGNCLGRTAEKTAAIAAFHAVLKIDPHNHAALYGLATCLYDLAAYQEALDYFNKVLPLTPHHLQTLHNRAATLHALGLYDDAAAAFQQILAAFPACDSARYNLALIRLLRADFSSLSDYEHRFDSIEPVPRRHATIPSWQGEPYTGKTLLIHCEQGLGDSLQIARFLPDVARRGGTLLVESPKPLIALFKAIEGVAGVFERGAQLLPPIDLQLPAMSLLRLFVHSEESIPSKVPYIVPPAAKKDHWQQILAQYQGRKVGLAWRGSTAHKYNADRSCPAALLFSLTTKCTNTQFFSLQLAPTPEEQQLMQHHGIIDLTKHLQDLEDTAALVANLDLVVSVDTSVAHLAGALAKPVWVMLPFVPDWRWQLERVDTPWYPTMRLFRQDTSRSWQTVTSQLDSELHTDIPPATIATQEQPLRIFCYRSGADYLLTAANQYHTSPVPLARELEQGHPALVPVDTPDQADFILFPDYLDAMLDNLGINGTRHFIRSLPHFSDYEARHIFYSNHDNSVPFDSSATFFQVSVNRFNHDPHVVSMPYPPAWINNEQPDYRIESFRYLTSFTGNIASSLIRGELVLSALREPRLSVYTDPIPRFHCHLDQEQQQARRNNYLQTIRDSLTVLCPRGEGLNSIRFFEAMAMGRIPVLVSDSTLLPFEDQVNYSECCLKIAEADIPRSGKLLADWIATQGAQRLLTMCKQARITWEQHFSQEALTHHTIEHLYARQHDLNQSDHASTTRVESASPDIESLFNYGTQALKNGDFVEALRLLQQAVSIAPRDAACRMHLAIALQNLERLDESETLLRTIISEETSNSDAWINLGITLQGQNRIEEALSCFRQAETLAPHDPRPPQNAGALYQALGRLEDAERFFIRALILKPDYGTARWNLALLRLLKDDYTAGFADFDARFSKVNPIPYRHSDLPEWDGQTQGQSILVWGEQGLGDTIQFVRFLPLLRPFFQHIYVECQSHTLAGIIASAPSIDQLFVSGQTLPPVTAQVPMMSLPHLLGTTFADLPSPTPYLAADPDKQHAWQSSLPPDSVLIGLAWRGNPQHNNDKNRSCPADLLLHLGTQFRDISFVSLQWQPTQAEQQLLLQHGIHDHTHRLHDLSDTAALIANLDLVITVDTAVAHLAGALGKRVWLLLPFAPDWRWGLERTDCPWYRTMRLFRQHQTGDWPHVITTVIEKLRTELPD